MNNEELIVEKSDSRLPIVIFSLIGLFTGFLVAIASAMALIYYNNLSFSTENFISIHEAQPLIWLIDTFPVIYLLIGYVTGRIIVGYNIRGKEKVVLDYRTQINNIINFAERLKSGDLNVSFDKECSEVQIVNALDSLKESLKKSKADEEQRRKEDAQRNWAAEGIAKFSEILRDYGNNLEDLSYNIISNIVKYTDGNQGGFFIMNEEDDSFDLAACYAYDRQKFMEKKIFLGEGLIGRCAQEKESIYMDDVPGNYVKITSGLGTSNPRNILIVPLKLNEEVHGVLELASFKTIEHYQIEFIEKLAESIASTISNTKINARTSTLLKESQDQAEELRSQEETMRQNMEELQATQEEMKKKEVEMEGVLDAIDNTVLKAEFDNSGCLVMANEKFLNLLQYKFNEVRGKNDEIFVSKVGMDDLKNNWVQLRNGIATQGIVKRKTKYDNEVWVLMSYTPVRDSSGNITKILFLANDITTQKQIELEAKAQSEELAVQENELRQNMEEMKATQEEMSRKELELLGVLGAIDITAAKIEYDTYGNILSVNDQYTQLMGYSLEEIKAGVAEKFLMFDDDSDFSEIWHKVNQGESYRGIAKFNTKIGNNIWLLMTYSPVVNKQGRVKKILCLANDITEQKRMEEELQLSQEVLSQKLYEATLEMKGQFKEIENIKILNEKTLEGMLDAILTIDEKCIIKFFNKAAEELWSINREDVIGKDFRTLIPEEDAQDDNFIENYVKPGVGMRREVNIVNQETKDLVSVLLLLSEAEIENIHTYTAFIQNIEVELF